MTTEQTQLLDALFEALSERARRVLTEAGARFDADDRIDEPALRNALHARGLPPLDALLAFHRAVSGLTATSLSLTFAPARHIGWWPPKQTPDGEIAIPVGSSEGNIHFIDARGVLYRSRSGPRGDELVPVAESPHILLEKLALVAGVESLAKGALRLRLRPLVGAALSPALRAEPVHEATDRFHRFFRRGALLIADGHPFRDQGSGDTLLWTPSLEDAVAALRAAPSAGVTAAEITTAGSELTIDPPGQAPEAPALELLRAAGALTVIAEEGEQRGAGHVWVSPASPRIEQTRQLAGAVLSWETIDTEGARVRDFTGASEALRPLLTARAIRGLARLGARIDPRRRGTRADLLRLLTRWGLPTHEPALAFEERCGGLHFSDLQWGPFWVVGQWPNPPDEAAAEDEEETLVPLAASVVDNVKYAMDAEGAVYLEDDHLPATPIAASFSTCLERLGAASANEVELPLSLRVEARVGPAVAAALGATPVPEGTDTYASMWCGDGISVLDEARAAYEGVPRTTVAARAEGDIVRARKAALEAAPDARVKVT